MAALPILVKHRKVSDKADGQDPSLLQPSDWNKEHVFKVDPVSLVGNLTDTVGDATSVGISDDFKFEDGELKLETNLSDIPVVVAADDPDNPDTARVLTTSTTVSWELPTFTPPTVGQVKANIVDNSITLAKMELSEVGSEIIYYDKTSKALVRLPAGTAGMVLKTGTVAIVGPPAVAATNPSWGFSGAPHAVLREQQAQGVDSHLGVPFTAGGWRDRIITAEVYDTYNFVTLAANVFTLGIGTWYIEWSCPAVDCKFHQTRLFNNTDTAHPVVYGTSEFCNEDNPSQTRSFGQAQVTVTVATGYKIQHFCTLTGLFGFGTGADSTTPNANSTELYTIVKIWRVA